MGLVLYRMMENTNLPRIYIDSDALKLREQADAFSGGNARTALQKYRQHLRESKRNGDQAKSAWALVQMAMVLRGQRQYLLALQLLDEARNDFSQIRNNAGLATTYYELSYCNRELDRNALALEYGQLAIRFFQGLGRTDDLGWVYDNIAVVYLNTFKRHESLTYAKKARAIFSEHKSSVGLAWNACTLGTLYSEMGLFPQSEEFFLEALERFNSLSHKQGLAWASLGVATIYRGRCKFPEAQDFINQAKAIYKQLGLKDRVGWCLLNESAIKRIQGKDEEAMLINKRCVQIFGPLRNHGGLGCSLFQIGQIYRDRGLFLKSWQTIREALNLHIDIGNRKGIAWGENDWGKTYLELNDINHARESLVKAKVLSEQLGDGSLKVEVDKNLASLHLDEGNLQKAVRLLDHVGIKAGEFQNRNIEAESYLEKARYYLMMGEIKKARYWINIVDSIIERNNLYRLKPRLFVFLGEVFAAEGKYDSVQAVLHDAVVMAKRFSQRHIKTKAQLGMIQELIRVKSSKNLSTLLGQVEKDVRMLSSRKVKAKYLVLKGLSIYRMHGRVDNKIFTQAVEALKSSGLAVLHKQTLSIMAEIYKMAGMEKELITSKNDMKDLMDDGPVDLHLVRSVSDIFEYPISMVS